MAAERLRVAMATAMSAPETGGVLLGRRILASRDVVVDLVLGPTPADRRATLAFIRGEEHQVAVDKAWAESSGTLNYLGDWHSHPQRHPSPSSRDLATWRRLAGLQVGEHLPMFFLIAGSEGAALWEIATSGEVLRLGSSRPDSERT